MSADSGMRNLISGRLPPQQPIIEGLSEEQCRALLHAKTGDLLLIETYPAPVEVYSDQDDDSNAVHGTDAFGWGPEPPVPEANLEPQEDTDEARRDACNAADNWGGDAADEPAVSGIDYGDFEDADKENEELLGETEVLSTEEADRQETDELGTPASTDTADLTSQPLDPDTAAKGQTDSTNDTPAVLESVTDGDEGSGDRAADGLSAPDEATMKLTETVTNSEPNFHASESNEETMQTDDAEESEQSGSASARSNGDGYDAEGFDAEGLDAEGFAKDGFDRYGFDHDGFDVNGYDQEGFDRDGYDENAYDREGMNSDRLDRDGYDNEGYDWEGLDRDGYYRDGLNQDGFDRYGFDVYGNPRDYSQTASMNGGLYIIVGKLLDDDGTVVDVYLQRLHYEALVAQATAKTYRIYGDEISVHEDAASTLDSKVESLSQVAGIGPEWSSVITHKPASSEVRDTVFQGECPAHACNNGFLYGSYQLQELMPDALPELSPFRPVCPACLGMVVLNEQIHLRTLVDESRLLDIREAFDHVTKRNQACVALGYVDQEFSEQGFDESEWGYSFDDLRPNPDDLQDGDDGIPWDQLPDEARDPNHNILPRPASEEVITALPRKLFMDLVHQEEGPTCGVCSTELEADTLMIQLPCGHAYCECLPEWLRHQHSCPCCRTIVTLEALATQKAGGERGDPATYEELAGDSCAITVAKDAYTEDVNSEPAQVGHRASLGGPGDALTH